MVGAIFTFSSIPYNPKHSIYNDSWNGASSFRKGIETDLNISTSRILVSPIILQSKLDINMIIIIGSERRYTNAEIDAYYEFILNGGSLVLFEDFGPAKDLVKKMGITFFQGTVKERNPYHYIKRPSQIFIRDVIISQIVEEFSIGTIMASEAAGILDIMGIARGRTWPILATYPSAFIDKNDNNKIDKNDMSNEFGIPIGLYKTIGNNNGSLVVISDSAIPLNQYWQREVTMYLPETGEDIVFTLSNAFWLLLFMAYLSQVNQISSIVFDESHQAIAVNSAAGILNLLAGTWIGIINTTLATLVILIMTFSFSLLRMRKKLRKNLTRKRFRRTESSGDYFISHPTSAERSISEQYIMYQVMGDSFVHVANSHLIKQLKSLGKSNDFIKQLEEDYNTDINNPTSLKNLLEIHSKLREHVELQKSKWL